MPQLEKRDEDSAIEKVADEHDRPVSDYEYDGRIPDWDELESVDANDA